MDVSVLERYMYMYLSSGLSILERYLHKGCLSLRSISHKEVSILEKGPSKTGVSLRKGAILDMCPS